jgi:SAM-dependent methyltransferase
MASQERVVSADNPAKTKPAPAPSGNADYPWAQFDSEAYFQHYYGEPHPDDDNVIRHAVEALKRVPPIGAELDVVDVGTGPSLIPFLCALPRARQLTAWEYAESNVDWLQAELRRDEMRSQCRHFWNVTREAYQPEYALPEDPMPALRAKSVVRRGSIFELPERTWDAATMFFCAESITEREDEFEAACAAYARCVKPGGTLAAAFLVRSAGYVVADRPFPVLCLSAEKIESVFARHAGAIKAERIGIREREIRSGYSGFIFLTGTAR